MTNTVTIGTNNLSGPSDGVSKTTPRCLGRTKTENSSPPGHSPAKTVVCESCLWTDTFSQQGHKVGLNPTTPRDKVRQEVDEFSPDRIFFSHTGLSSVIRAQCDTIGLPMKTRLLLRLTQHRVYSFLDFRVLEPPISKSDPVMKVNSPHPQYHHNSHKFHTSSSRASTSHIFLQCIGPSSQP